ncbi:short-chain fatty acid transporter [Thermodesulfobacteriota bacterium]
MRRSGRFLEPLGRLSAAFNRWVMKYLPGSLGIAFVLTIIVFCMGMAIAGASLASCIRSWGDGFWALLTFGMQMCLIMFTGSLIAHSPIIDRLLDRLAKVPRGPYSAIAFMTLFSSILGYLHWGLSMVLSAFMIRRIAARQPKVDYALLTISAYCGVSCIFHAGLSASAPLMMATTQGNFLAAEYGIIPVSDTLFSEFNLILAGFMIVFLTTVTTLLHPHPGGETVQGPAGDEERRGVPAADPQLRRKPADFLEHTPILNWTIALLGFAWLAAFFSREGLKLDLNVVNFAFLMLAFLAHPSPASIVHAGEDAGRIVYGIILQFPLYAGMYGVIRGTGLAEIIGGWFVRIADADTYPLVIYWYSGLMNYFVPSGGSKWAIEAPYILSAARELGVDLNRVVVSYAWGDMSTNIIQPFWAIPILAVAGLEFREIMKYAVPIFLANLVVVSAALYFFGG